MGHLSLIKQINFIAQIALLLIWNKGLRDKRHDAKLMFL